MTNGKISYWSWGGNYEAKQTSINGVQMIFIVKKMKKNINKITWACYLLVLFWLGACTPNQVHNFQIDNIGMQNVSLDGWQGSNQYCVKLIFNRL